MAILETMFGQQTLVRELIADRIAKHHVVFGENHFDYGGIYWVVGQVLLIERTDSLLQWCTANKHSCENIFRMGRYFIQSNAKS